MSFVMSKLGLILASTYALIMTIVLYFDFQSVGNNFWSNASLWLTMPWSVGVIFIGFGLIHISSYGLEYGFTFCALLNTVIFYLYGRAVSRANT
jgi:hypothetical protein